mmetsp:Transcript_36194/g.55579  ORF Transcript_36194/g.55579 Transcript_36194/m.55579 type:complete len:207 (-) Transcript_36194:90-710(-)
MQRENYSKLSKRQYLDLNVRIQKSLILDFDLASAKQSAIEDWKIDVEREMVDKKENADLQDGEVDEQASGKDNTDANPNIIQGVTTQSIAENQDELEGIKETEDELAGDGKKDKKAILKESVDTNPEEEDSIDQIPGPEFIEYERLSEFFFDLCLSWCQHLDIEMYIFFLNGIFLNITQGTHVSVSTFKEIEEIDVLSVEFFNKLL